MARSIGPLSICRSDDVIPLSRPHEAVQLIGGHRYQIRFWTFGQWDRLTEDGRPGNAQRLGTAGWIDIQPEHDKA
jgi:hypothetical protein